MPINHNILVGASGGGSSYVISNSCRFNDNDSAYLTWTPGSAPTSDKIQTISFWIKICTIDANNRTIMDQGAGDRDSILIQSPDMQIRWDVNSGTGTSDIKTTAFYRDPSAWYHFVFVQDTTEVTASDRQKIFVNGVRVTSWATSTFPALNDTFGSMLASGVAQYIGSRIGGSQYSDCYLAEFVHIDGTAYAETNFGEFDANGNWVPIDPSGLTFGTNGYWLDFADSTNFGRNASTSGIQDFASVNYDGTADHATFTPHANIDSGTASFSISAWMKQDVQKNHNAIVSIGDMTIGADDGGKLQIAVYSTAALSTTASPLSINVWHHIVCTHAGGAVNTTNTKLYVNGAEEASTGSCSITLDTTGYIGRKIPGGDVTFDGNLAYIGIWDEAITAAEVLAIYDNHNATFDLNTDSGNYASQANLVHYWKSQEGTGTTLTDTTGTSNAALVSAPPWVLNGNNAWVSSGLAANDQTADSPTDDADNGVGNAATLNPLDKGTGTLSNGNLDISSMGADNAVRGTMWVPADDADGFYVEFYGLNASIATVGLMEQGVSLTGAFGTTGTWAWRTDGNEWNYSSGTPTSGTGSTWTATDNLGIMIKNNSATFYKNGVLDFTCNAGLSGQLVAFYIAAHSATITAGGVVNGISIPFNETPPTGSKRFCTCDIAAPAIPDPSAHFQTELYTGDSGGQAFSTSVTTNGSGNTGNTIRILLTAANIAQNGTSVAISLKAHSSSGATIDNAYIGQAATSGDAYDFASTPTEILWSGTSGVTLGAGANTESDFVTFTLDSTKDHIISFYLSAGDIQYGGAVAGYSNYYKSGNDASTVNATGYTGPSTAESWMFNLLRVNGGTQVITQSGNSQFGPDLLVIKNRDQADEWKVLDSTRGATKEMNWDSKLDETTDANGVTAISATDGFTLGTGAGGYNDNTEDFIAYQWEEGATPGFDIVQYTGTGSNTTFAHSLGVAADLMIIKPMNPTTWPDAENWAVFHSGNDNGPSHAFRLNDTIASQADATMFNSTAPTSSVFSVGANTGSNESGTTFMAYLWASVGGFSKFGSYTGNGSADGPFIYTGFRPACIIVKSIANVLNWYVFDNKRDAGNLTVTDLLLNSTAVEDATGNAVDFLSNGFKVRATNSGVNLSGSTFVYAAWAEFPFGGSGVAQARAR